MLTLSDAIRLPSMADTAGASGHAGTYKVHYRAWLWLGTFALGTGFWVAVGYSVYAILG